MNMSNEIRRCAMELFRYSGRCSIKTLQLELQKQGINIDDKSSIVRTILYRMNLADPIRIHKVGRGEYKYSQCEYDFDKIQDCIEEIADYLRNFNFYASSEDEIQKAKKLACLVKKHYLEVEDLVNQLDL